LLFVENHFPVPIILLRKFQAVFKF